ncbi:MAG: hypothetical protein J5775_04645, partial [Spirochaetales bacterium]|nr:hypothetical protein [Spirochaetales bacterium]
MKKTIIILISLMLLASMPIMAMGLAEDAKAAGYKLPGQEAAAAPAVDWLSNAADYIKALYDKGTLEKPAPRTPADYEVFGRMIIGGSEFTIAWSTDTEYVKAEVKDENTVLINIDEAAPAEIVYTLTAVISDAEGKTATVAMLKTLPQGSNDPAPEEIVLDAYKLVDGEAMTKEVRLSGVVTSIPTAYSEQYGNITVYIQVGALSENLIQCYRLSGEGCAALKEGDVITVQGKIKNYTGTIEFDKPT